MDRTGSPPLAVGFRKISIEAFCDTDGEKKDAGHRCYWWSAWLMPVFNIYYARFDLTARVQPLSRYGGRGTGRGGYVEVQVR